MSGTRITLLTVLLVLLFFGVSVLGGVMRSVGQGSGDITESWVDQMLVQWQPTQYHQMSYAALIIPASYDQIDYSYNTLQVLQGYLNVMESSGAGYIRIDVGYDAWLNGRQDIQAELTTLVNQMRSDGKGFILADASAEAYRPITKRLPWDQFKQAWVERVTTLAQTFHPDYYVVIKEPGWYVGMISDALTNPQVMDPNQWLGLTQNLTNAVHSVSPETKVGVAIAADSLNQNPSLYVPYMEGLSSISGLNFMGFDIYTTTGFTATQNYLSAHGNGGLAVWVAECWSASDGSTVYNSSRSTLDMNWILAQYYWAQRENVSMMVPFFTNAFASYSLTDSSPTDSSQILSLQQQRTPVFHMYQNITAGLENIPAGNNTTTTSTTPTQSQSTSTVSTPTTTTTTTSSGQETTSSSGGTAGRGGFPVTEVVAAVVVVLVLVVVGFLATRKRR